MTALPDPNGTGGPWRLAERYVVEEMIGKAGGQGEVHIGYDERLDRPVAIKLLHPPRPLAHTATAEEQAEAVEEAARQVERFKREMRTAARLGLPGIPAIHDADVDAPTGRLFLVMELLAGACLDELLQAREFDADPPSVEWAAAIGAQLASTLVEVHRADIVHRDIKPGNIFVTDGGHTKLLDFGIALLTGKRAQPRLTQAMQAVGTPRYMSPEQCVDNTPGPASDVYSLGCVLFELLTNRSPFPDAGDDSWFHHQVFSAPARAAELREGVPSEIEDLIDAMLSKSPDARPDAQTVYDMLAFHAFPLPGSTADGLCNPLRPFAMPMAPVPRPRAEAVVPTVSSLVPLSEGESDLIRAEAQVFVQQGQPHRAIELLDGALVRGGVPDVVASMLMALARTAYLADEYPRAARAFERAEAELSTLYGPSDPEAIEAAQFAGLAYAELGRYEKALPHLERFLRTAQSEDLDTVAVRMARFARGRMLVEAGRVDEARREFRELRSDFIATYGVGSAHVTGLDLEIDKIDRRGG